MKIVVLDGRTINPGDLSWDWLNQFQLGEPKIYETTEPDQVIPRIKDAEFVFLNKTGLDAAVFEACEQLKYVGVLATGYNNVDVEAAKRNGVVVCNTPGYGSTSVAQLAFALILELCHHVGNMDTLVRNGEWPGCPEFAVSKTPLVDLLGKTLGIIGFGNIGKMTARIGQAFGMNVVAYSHNTNEPYPGVTMMSLQELLSCSDFVSIHCPLTDETRNMINMDTLKLMKPSAFIINTARGPVINDKDLANALNLGIIAGAGLDVVSVEPIKPDNPLLFANNCIFTPHMAGHPKEARARLLSIASDNLKMFLNGTPVNVVSK